MRTTTWGPRSLAATTAFGVALLAGMIPAGAGNPRIVIVDPTTVAQGENFTASGPADCITGTTLTITVIGLGLSQQVGGDSPWQVPFTAPADATPGTYPVSVTGEECSYVDANVMITEAVTTTTAAPTTTVAVAAAAAAAPTFTG